MLFKNPVRTSKRTPHFTITKINWLTLFKFNFGNYRTLVWNVTLQYTPSDKREVFVWRARHSLSDDAKNTTGLPCCDGLESPGVSVTRTTPGLGSQPGIQRLYYVCRTATWDAVAFEIMSCHIYQQCYNYKGDSIGTFPRAIRPTRLVTGLVTQSQIAVFLPAISLYCAGKTIFYIVVITSEAFWGKEIAKSECME